MKGGKRIGLCVFQRTGALLGRYQIGGEGSGNGMGSRWRVVLGGLDVFVWHSLLLEEAVHQRDTICCAALV